MDRLDPDRLDVAQPDLDGRNPEEVDGPVLEARVAAQCDGVLAQVDAAMKLDLSGHVVMPGACTKMIPVAPGDVVRVEFDRLGPVSVAFG